MDVSYIKIEPNVRVVFLIYQPRTSKFMPNVCMNTGMTKAKATMIINPILVEFTYFIAHGFSDQPKNIFEPSNGGIGKILNTAKMMLNTIKLIQKAVQKS